MAGVTHPFVSGISDGADATLVRPSNWNAAHTVTTATPTTQAFGDVAAPGSGSDLTLATHRHGMPANPANLPFRGGGALYYSSSYGSAGNLVLVQNTEYAIPFYVPVATTFTSIAVATPGVASSAARLGIYNDSGGVPGTLVADYGTVATTSSGMKAIAISQLLAAGWYWLACAVQGAAGSLVCTNGGFTGGNPGLNPVANLNNPGAVVGYSQTGISSGLASPWGATLTEQVRVPVIGLAPQ